MGSNTPTPGRYLLTGLIYLTDTGYRLDRFTMTHSGRKIVRRYYGPPPRIFEEFTDDSDRPTFRADTIERAVLEKLRQFMSDERNKRAIRTEIDRRTEKAVANVSRIESELADVRAKQERATEILALANREKISGITKLLVGWTEQESQLKDKLRQANGQQAPSPKAMAIMNRLDDLLSWLDEEDRENHAFVIRQTLKRITLRRERRQNERHCIPLWGGVIEPRDDLGVVGVISLTEDDTRYSGRWPEVADLIRQRGGVVYFCDA